MNYGSRQRTTVHELSIGHGLPTACDATMNGVLHADGTPYPGAATIDKYEYAACCGRHGTLPEHVAVEDITPDGASVWSLHTDLGTILGYVSLEPSLYR